jgi:hypothetical protein
VVANLKMAKKSKPQILEETQKATELRKFKALAEKTLIPIFVENDVTAYQAGQFIDVLKNVSLGKMNRAWSERSYSELGMAEELALDKDMDDKSGDIYKALLIALNDVPVAEAMKLFDVFTRVIEMYAHKKVMEVRFTDLPMKEILSV